MNSKFFPANGFSEYQNTSSKTEILDAGRNEIEFLFHHKIVTYVEKFKIPRTLVHNLDQISLKYVPVSNETMAKRGSSSITTEGRDDKRMITETLLPHFLKSFG